MGTISDHIGDGCNTKLRRQDNTGIDNSLSNWREHYTSDRSNGASERDRNNQFCWQIAAGTDDD
jgi:hypothetical protein